MSNNSFSEIPVPFESKKWAFASFLILLLFIFVLIIRAGIIAIIGNLNRQPREEIVHLL